MKFPRLPYCVECGEARVAHPLERIPHVIEAWVMGSYLPRIVFTTTDRALTAFFGAFLTPDRLLSLARIFARMGIVGIKTIPDEHDTTRTAALYEGAGPAGVTLYTCSLFKLPFGFIAEKEVGGTVMRVAFRLIPRPRNIESASLTWMDDKGILKEKMLENGIPTARGGVATSEEEAIRIFREVGRPVITKPHQGSRGRHTTLDIKTEEDVRRGFRIAAQLSPKVVVETYLHGSVHRVTLIGGKPVAIARREYPHVVGDGIHTVEELIDRENQNPMRDGFFYRKLDKEHRATAELTKQGLTLASIPEQGRRVILNDKNSRLHGTVTEDLTDQVHPVNIELFTRLGTVLADPVVGVDIMIDDVTRPWTEQEDVGVLECNSMPFIDVHHKVVSGRTINVAKYLWDEVFKSV